MAKVLAVLAVVCVLASAAYVQSAKSQTKSQTKPDLSGNWLLNRKKSDDSGLTTRPDLPIRIAHSDPEFRVTRPTESNGQIVERNFVYFTDGRGETNQATSGLTTNPSAGAPGKLKDQESKTKWSGNKIVTRMPLRLSVAGTFIEFGQIDEWKLSNDGKVLTQTSRVVLQRASAPTFIPAMAHDKKRVYNRV